MRWSISRPDGGTVGSTSGGHVADAEPNDDFNHADPLSLVASETHMLTGAASIGTAATPAIRTGPTQWLDTSHDGVVSPLDAIRYFTPD